MSVAISVSVCVCVRLICLPVLQYPCLGKSAFKRGDIQMSYSEAFITKELVALSEEMLSEPEELPEKAFVPSYLTADNDSYTNIQSQDSYYGDTYTPVKQPVQSRNNKLKRTGSTNSTTSQCSMHEHKATVALTVADLIVEKMHVHYGQKDKNPVNNMRFFPKNASDSYIAVQEDEKVYETSLPKVFEDFATRVFLRDSSKERHAREVFERWCVKVNSHTPFPSMSQRAQSFDEGEEEEEEETDMQEGSFFSPFAEQR